MNSSNQKKNRSKFSFYSQIYYYLFVGKFSFYLSWENIPEGLLKFCKLISNLILGQIIDSNLTNVHKQTSNTKITQAYHSRFSSWKLSRKATVARKLLNPLTVALSKVKNENDAIPNRITEFWQATHFSTKNPINKPAMNKRTVLIAAVFHFVHSVEKDS